MTQTTDPQLPDDVLKRWESCSRAEAIRQCEDSDAALIKAHESVDNLQGQVRELRAEIANQDVLDTLGSVPYAPNAGETGASDDPSAQWDGARDDDKIYVLRTLLDSTSAQGTDMANFIRRIRLILGA